MGPAVEAAAPKLAALAEGDDFLTVREAAAGALKSMRPAAGVWLPER
jgi:hypothetical protein